MGDSYYTVRNLFESIADPVLEYFLEKENEFLSFSFSYDVDIYFFVFFDLSFFFWDFLFDSDCLSFSNISTNCSSVNVGT